MIFCDAAELKTLRGPRRWAVRLAERVRIFLILELPDHEKAFRVAKQIKVGGVMLNDVPMYRADHMPYGGVKNSGVGREGPRYAIEEMTEMKLICWRV